MDTLGVQYLAQKPGTTGFPYWINGACPLQTPEGFQQIHV